jgi:uncharacterized membrane protein YeiB
MGARITNHKSQITNSIGPVPESERHLPLDALRGFALLGILMIAVSPLWLRHFEFRPFEWLWRTLTYGQARPLRRASVTATV